jgi:hypothetical protein
MAKMDGIRQRAEMGMGKGAMDGGEKFGVKSFGDTCCDGQKMGPAESGILPESKRTIPVPGGRGRMKNQGQPEHGPHGYSGWDT